MEDNQIQFLPFSAINEFMRDDFRMKIIRTVLSNQSSLPASIQDPINRIIHKVVKVPGFRNSEHAPTAVKLIPTVSAFQKSPELVAALLTAWAEIQSDLRQQIYKVLKQRGWMMFPDEIQDPSSLAENLKLRTEADWGVLPPNANRARLPGFLIYWPAAQSYEDIYNDFIKLFPEANNSLDEVSLMTVWLSLRLPYKVAESQSQAENNPEEHS